MDGVRGSLLGALMLSLAATTHAGAVTSPERGTRSENFTDLAPSLLPESLRLDSAVSPGEYVFVLVVDTAGRVEPGTVQTLMAVDSASAAPARAALGAVRYTPARMIQVTGACVRIDGAARHCGSVGAPVKRLRKRVLLRFEVESSATR